MGWKGVITDHGAEILAQGDITLYEKPWTGSGYCADANMRSVTSLVNMERAANIVSFERDGGTWKIQLLCKAKVSGYSQTGAYTLREIGLFRYSQPSVVDTAPIAYFKNEAGIEIPAYSEFPDFAYSLWLTVVFGNDSDITINVDQSVALTASTLPGTAVTFSDAASRTNIASGDALNTMLGKIKKWFTDLKDAAFCTVANNLATTEAGAVLDARQGAELNDMIEATSSVLGGAINNIITTIGSFKVVADDYESPSSGKTKTYTLTTLGTYLVVVSRYNATSEASGAYIASVHTSNSNLIPLFALPSSTGTVSINKLVLTVSLAVNYTRVSVIQLG